MPDRPRPMVDVRARIAHLERRRAALLGTADTSATMARMYERILSGKPTVLRTRSGRAERELLVTKYCELRARRLAESVIAKAHARCLSIEICALRAISGESLQGTQR